MPFSFQVRTDIIDVLCGARPAARLTMKKNGEAGRISQYIISLGLQIAVGRVTRFQKIKSLNRYVDCFEPASSDGEEFINLYLSCSLANSELSRDCDEAGDDNGFGLSLGYPKCCIQWMCRRKRVPALTECFALYASEGRYFADNWPTAAAIDASLTPHFPCSPGCRHTREFTNWRWSIIKECAGQEIIQRVSKAHSQIYGLNSEGRILMPVHEGDSNLVAKAKPVSFLS